MRCNQVLLRGEPVAIERLHQANAVLGAVKRRIGERVNLEVLHRPRKELSLRPLLFSYSLDVYLRVLLHERRIE